MSEDRSEDPPANLPVNAIQTKTVGNVQGNDGTLADTQQVEQRRRINRH